MQHSLYERVLRVSVCQLLHHRLSVQFVKAVEITDDIEALVGEAGIEV